LGRPVAGVSARAALLVRIGGDVTTRDRAVAQIDVGDLRGLMLHARPGRSDSEVIASWRAQAKANQKTTEAEADARKRQMLSIPEDGAGCHVFTPPRP